MADRRKRVWTQTVNTITVGTLGQPGQIFVAIDPNLRSAFGLSTLAGFTVVRTHACVLIDSSTNTSSSFIKANMGVGIFPEGMDNGDHPNLEIYAGNYFAFECFSFQMPGVASTIVLPSEASFTRSDYKSQRVIPRPESRIHMVLQQDTTEIVRYRTQISMLLLMP